MKTYFISGHHSVIAAIKNKTRFKKVLYLSKKNTELENLATKNNLKFSYVETSTLNKLLKNSQINHQNVALEVGELPIKKIIKDDDYLDDFLVLNEVSDPRNIGAIIRCALAFSIKNIIIEKNKVNLSSNFIHRSSSGCIDLVNIFTVVNITHALKILKQKNYWSIAFSSHAKENLFSFQWPKKNVFLFGSEGKGLKKKIENECDYKLKIPINKEVESLNVSNSVSAVLAIYNLKKLMK